MNSSVQYVESTQEKRLIYNFVCVHCVWGQKEQSLHWTTFGPCPGAPTILQHKRNPIPTRAHMVACSSFQRAAGRAIVRALWLCMVLLVAR